MLEDVIDETHNVITSLTTEFVSQQVKFTTLVDEYREQNKKVIIEVIRTKKQLAKLATASDHLERSMILISELFKDGSSKDEICCEIEKIIDIYERADTKALYAYGRERLTKIGYVTNENGKYERPLASPTSEESLYKKQKIDTEDI